MTSLTFLEDQWSDPNIRAVFVTFVLSLIIEIGRRALTPRARVAWGVSHDHIFIIPQVQAPPSQGQSGSNVTLPAPPPVTVHTRELWVQNIGRATAKDVMVALNFEPQHLELWPVIPYQRETAPDGRIFLRFDHLARREFVAVSLFEARHGSELPLAIAVRWADGIARQLPMGPQRILARWQIECLRVVLIIGFVASIYLLIRAIQLVAG